MNSKITSVANLAVNTAILSLATYTHTQLKKTKKKNFGVLCGMTMLSIAVSSMQTERIINVVRKEALEHE